MPIFQQNVCMKKVRKKLILRSFVNMDTKVLLDWSEDEISVNEELPTVNIATTYMSSFLIVTSVILGFVKELKNLI